MSKPLSAAYYLAFFQTMVRRKEKQVTLSADVVKDLILILAAVPEPRP